MQSRPADSTGGLSRLPDAISACRVRRIGHCNISKISKNIVLFFKLLKKITILKKLP
jgi:hypothetical protein